MLPKYVYFRLQAYNTNCKNCKKSESESLESRYAKQGIRNPNVKKIITFE